MHLSVRVLDVFVFVVWCLCVCVCDVCGSHLIFDILEQSSKAESMYFGLSFTLLTHPIPARRKPVVNTVCINACSTPTGRILRAFLFHTGGGTN